MNYTEFLQTQHKDDPMLENSRYVEFNEEFAAENAAVNITTPNNAKSSTETLNYIH